MNPALHMRSVLIKMDLVSSCRKNKRTRLCDVKEPILGSHSYLSQKQDEVSYRVDGGHTQHVLSQEDEGVSSRRTEAGAVNRRCDIGVLRKRTKKKKNFIHTHTPQNLTNKVFLSI